MQGLVYYHAYCMDRAIVRAGKRERLSEYASMMKKYQAVLKEGKDYLC